MNDIWVYPAAFLAGLGLNLTPCVYPMVSITISIFSRNQSGKLFQSFIRSCAYVAGVITMYAGLGAAAVFSGGLFGAWMQHRAVTGLIGIVFLVMALSMFGIWRLEMPRSLVDHASKQTGGNLIGLYFSGLFVGVFAAPCIGPPVAAILAWAGTNQQPIQSMSAIFLMGLGLGIPYILLGTFAAGLKKLPKAGDWLVWFERVFAVILSGFAVYYLSLSLYSDAVFLILPVGLVFGGAYLGYIQRSGDSHFWFRWSKRVAGLIAVVLGLWLFQPPQTPTGSAELNWEPFDEPTFITAVKAGEPTALDFYADWCLPCHEMERITYRDPLVIEALDGFRTFKVDLTYSSEKTAEWSSFFKISGMPTLLFFDQEGVEVERSRVVGFIPPDQLLPILKKVRQSIDLE